MTRQTLLAALVLLATALVGCAAEQDGVEVVTADLDDAHFELVELHGEGDRIDVEIYYQAGQAEEVSRHFEWGATDPIPTELVSLIAGFREDLLAEARPLSADAQPVQIDREAVWPRLLQLARFERELSLATPRCDDTTGFTHCIAH